MVPLCSIRDAPFSLLNPQLVLVRLLRLPRPAKQPGELLEGLNRPVIVYAVLVFQCFQGVTIEIFGIQVTALRLHNSPEPEQAPLQLVFQEPVIPVILFPDSHESPPVTALGGIVQFLPDCRVSPFHQAPDPLVDNSAFPVLAFHLLERQLEQRVGLFEVSHFTERLCL